MRKANVVIALLLGTLLAGPAIAQETTAAKPAKSAGTKTAPTEFMSLAHEALDSVDRVNSAVMFSRVNWEKADLDAKEAIQKLERAAKSTEEKHAYGYVTDFLAGIEKCRTDIERYTSEGYDDIRADRMKSCQEYASLTRGLTLQIIDLAGRPTESPKPAHAPAKTK
jgi:hypothetical protein